MIQQSIKVGLCLVVASVVLGSGDAEARCRSRGRCCGWGYGYANACGNNCGFVNNCSTGCGVSRCGAGGCGINSGCGVNGCGVGGCGVNGCSAAVNGQIIQPTATTVPVDSTYSVSKPIYNDQNPQLINQPGVVQPAPAPIDNRAAPQIKSTNPALQNTSPDPDNEGRNASKIQGTAPTKAPAPAANANP